MDVTDPGMVADFSELHEYALSPMEVTVCGIVTVSSPEQSKKAHPAIFVIESGIVIDGNLCVI